MACPCKGSPHSRTFKEVVVMIPFYRGENWGLRPMAMYLRLLVVLSSGLELKSMS